MSKKIPLIALIGLPNAGKSTLVNRLSGSKLAIVANEAHTTRDLSYGEDYWEGMYMRFVDTGGLVPDTRDKILKAVQIRSWSAVAEADILIWVIDRKQNPETIPESIVQKVWKTGKPVLICINKVDDPNFDKNVSEYARLGGFDFVNVSANSGYGLNTLMDVIVDKLEQMGFEKTGQLAQINSQKTRQRRKLAKEVRKDKDGSYYIVRNEDGLFQSVKFSNSTDNAPKADSKTKSKIKNLVFDFWGVIFTENTRKLAENIAEQIENGQSKVDDLSYMLNELIDLSSKNESLNDWSLRYQKLTSLEAFEENLWGRNFYVDLKLAATIKSLAKLYNIYYLTNIDEQSFEVCREADIFKIFKGGLASYKTGLKKPDPKFFDLLLSDYNMKAEETIFFDDLEENIEAATNKGIYGVVFDHNTMVEEEIKRIESRAETSIELSNSTEIELPKILLLGKPNVGKSSLFNAMLGQEIQIVTDIAGTTLSVNDSLVEREIQPEGKNLKKKYIILDSVGIRRPGQRTFGVESFATFRTVEAAHQADVICLILDGSQPLSHQDQVVAGIIKQAHKGLVVIANKEDLVDVEQRQKFVRDFFNKFNFLKVDKFIWVTATESKSGELNEIWDSIDESLASREKVIEKTELRKLFNYLMKQKPPKKLRIKKKPVVYDLLYSKNKPPTFELLVKDKTTIHWSYLRFLENIIRKNFGFTGTEIVVRCVEIDRKKVLSD
ncbi:MAG: HAD-IA family hydrolase [Patescibacteria group bacterium]